MKTTIPHDLLHFLKTRSAPKRLLRVGLALTSTIYSLRPEVLMAKPAPRTGVPRGGWLGEGGPASLELPTTPARTRGELFFIDADVADPGAFWLAAPKSATVVCIPAGVDSWAFMAHEAEQFRGLGAIHIISHGGPGMLLLNGRRYFAADLKSRSAQLSKLGRALAKNGDLLLYGCNTGQGEMGARLINCLADITGADVAASSNFTGGLPGDDWNLEIATGHIETSVATPASYAYELGNVTVTTNADSGAGSLRNAIASAVSGDTIIFNTGSMASTTITLTSGQLNISKNLVIEGDVDSNGTADITVDANYSSRVFNVSSGQTVSFDGLIIKRGLVAGDGGTTGAPAAQGSDAYGGAIYNDGSLTLTHCTVTASGASGGGGGGSNTSAALGGSGGGGGGGGLVGVGGGNGASIGSGGGAHSGAFGGGGVGGAGGAGASYLAGKGGSTSGGAGGTIGLGGYSFGGSGGTANNGTLSIGGGGGGAGFDATGGRGGNAAGAIFNTGILTILTSTISNNVGAGGGGGGGGYSGLPGNGGDGGRGVGGIWSTNTGTLRFDATSFSNLSTNSGGSGGGGSANGSGSSGAAGGSNTNYYNLGALDTNYIPNAAPTISNLNGDTSSFTEGGVALHIDSGTAAVVADTDSADFNTGNLTVAITSGGTGSEDVLGIDTSGTVSLSAGVTVGSHVSASGVDIGTISSDGTSGANLVVGFNSSATPARATTLVDALTYRNTNNAAPSTTTRTVSVTVNDGDGATSAAAVVSVAVVGVNDAPTLSATGSTPTFTENGAAVTLFSGTSISTVESGQTIDTLTLTVSNVTDGSSEILNVDGTALALTTGNSVTTATNGMTASVVLSSGTATVSITKAAGISSAAAQTLVNGLSYQNNSSNPSTASRVVTLTSIQDNGGTSNSGVDTTSLSVAATVTVVAVNNAPVATASGGTTAFSEGANVTSTPVVLDSGVTVSDLDNTTLASATVSITSNFQSAEDVLAFTNDGSTMGNIAGSYNSTSGVLALTSSGATATLAQWQSALRSVTYTNSSDTPNTSNRTIGFVVNDSTSNSSATTKTVSVTAVNDAPVATVPVSITAIEDVTTAITGISFADVDAGSSSVTVTLSVTSGSLAATSGSGVTVGGTSSALTLTGSIANINAFIAASNVSFTTVLNATASVTLTTTINDNGNTGTGGAKTDSGTTTINVTAVNDAPTISAPGSISVTEDVASALTGISFADVDGGSGLEVVSLSVSSGSITAISGSGVTVGGTNSALTLTGTIANLNAYLAASNVSFTTTLDATGNVTLTVGINDNGNTGIGGAQTASTTVTLSVVAVNDPPVNSVPGAQSLSQDSALTFSTGGGNLISVSDVDANGGSEQVTLTVTHGTITLSGTSGLSFVVGSGSGDTTMTFTGTLPNINNALNGLVYTPASGYFGSAALQITTNDQGNTGTGGAQTATNTINLTVNPLNPSVANVSSSSANGTYKLGDAIALTITFSSAVTINTSGGTPTLLLATGSVNHTASYTSGSGTATLTFTYVVQAGDQSADLDYQSTSALVLNGATIRNVSNLDAVLTLPTVGGASSIAGQKAIVVDGVVPAVGSVTVPVNGTYVAGQNLDFTVNFSEAVVVNTAGGTPRIAVTLNTGGTVYATYISGSGTSALTFRLTVTTGELDSDGITLGTTIDLNGGTLRDAAANNATPALNSVGVTTGVHVDAVAPSVVSITRTAASAMSNATQVTFTVTFSEAVSGVDVSDFTLTATGTVTGSLLSVSAATGTTMQVVVGSLTGDGTLRLDLNSSGTGIVDTASNAISGGFTAGEVYTLDHTAPAAPSVPTTALNPTANPRPVITGTAETASTVKIYDGATLIGTVTADASTGAWSFTPSTALADGAHTITARATDAAGNTGAASTALLLAIDTTAPTITTVTGSPASGTTLAAGSTLPVTINTSESVTWSGSINPTLALLAGSTPVAATYTSGKGTATLVFTATVPTLTSTATLSVSGFSATPPLTDGVGNALANQATATGWAGSPMLPTWTIPDSIAPTVTTLVGAPVTGSTISAAGSLTVTLNFSETVTWTGATNPGLKLDLGGSAVTATYASGKGTNAVVFTVWSANAPTLVANTALTVTGLSVSPSIVDTSVIANAMANQTTATSWGVALPTWTVKDGVAPAASAITTASGLTANAKPSISGTAEPFSIVKIYDGTTLIGSTTAIAAGTWSFTPTTALADGVHTITATATDAAGNTGAASTAITLTIDTIAPAAPVILTASGNTTVKTPTLTGTAELLTTVKVYDGTTLIGSTTATGAGAWSLTLVAVLADGTHTITATATDAAGNVSLASSALTLIVGTVPAITASPTALAVPAGSPASLMVSATGTPALSYQWQRSVDNTTFTALSGATSASYTLASATVAATGYYRVVVTNTFGTATSASAFLTVTPGYAAPTPDGFASSVTGGGAGASVVVLTATDFQTQATSTTACTITVVGPLSIGTVNVASNKTIQGADGNATLVGNLNLTSSVSNVIVRGLNLSNPGTTIASGAYTDGGSGITITGARNVFITHCTFFDCADHALKIVSAADNITVSWSEFYYTAVQTVHRYSVLIGNAGVETAALHVSLHHNLWSTGVDQRMPSATYGYVHLYNNVFATPGNTSGSDARDQSQFLSERNIYTGVNSPLTRTNANTALAIGRILALGNVYTGTTGTAPYNGTDAVLTPPYSYEALPTSDVTSVVTANAGNNSGAGYTDAPIGSASITGPTATVPATTAFALTAVPTGFTAATYQWRLNNIDIAGATASTYTVDSAQDANAGTYTVAIGLVSGDMVVSTPITVTLGSRPAPIVQNLKLDKWRIGGGAVSTWSLGALALLYMLRKIRRRRLAEF